MTTVEKREQQALRSAAYRRGRCAQCRGPRLTRIAKNSALRGADRARVNEALASDPFCKNTCARAWHGCPLPKAVGRPRLEEEAA